VTDRPIFILPQRDVYIVLRASLRKKILLDLLVLPRGKLEGKNGTRIGKARKNPKIGRGIETKSSRHPNVKAEHEITKKINRKNEALVAAKAVSVGSRLFLSDIRDKGKNEVKNQARVRNKKESKATKASDRIKVQLQKIGGDV
jgi:hypothetical protein